MSRLKFYLDKASYLTLFIWWREWELVRDEWNLTYRDALEAEARADETDWVAFNKLVSAVEKRIEACSSMAERHVYTVEDAGSSPAAPTNQPEDKNDQDRKTKDRG
jgi:hypothetical protein